MANREDALTAKFVFSANTERRKNDENFSIPTLPYGNAIKQSDDDLNSEDRAAIAKW